MTASNDLWRKILLALLPLAIAGLVGYGALKSDVKHVEQEVATKANQETVTTQYEAILRELQRLNTRLDERSRHP